MGQRLNARWSIDPEGSLPAAMIRISDECVVWGKKRCGNRKCGQARLFVRMVRGIMIVGVPLSRAALPVIGMAVTMTVMIRLDSWRHEIPLLCRTEGFSIPGVSQRTQKHRNRKDNK